MHGFAWSNLTIYHRNATPRLCMVIPVNLPTEVVTPWPWWRQRFVRHWHKGSGQRDRQTHTYTHLHTHTHTLGELLGTTGPDSGNTYRPCPWQVRACCTFFGTATRRTHTWLHQHPDERNPAIRRKVTPRKSEKLSAILWRVLFFD